MNQLHVVITMGGAGARFQKAGYTVPKYMIMAKEKTLFEWAMISLDGFRNEVVQYIFIARAEEGIAIKEFIEEKCAILGINNYKIILLDYLTDGQATTAMLGKKYWIGEEALLIYNIDTYVEPGEMKTSDLKGDGFIPCFRAEGDHWSFVRLDAAGHVTEIREKCRISEYCTLGAYYFRTCNLYEMLYNEYYKSEAEVHDVNGEKYIAPLYNFLLEKGGEIYISDIAPEKVHVLGTPKELEEFLTRQEFL